MASKIIGRRVCPWCGFEHAHVKESDKCLYFFCPDCGTNGPHARTGQQRANMVKGMRPEGGAKPAAVPTPTPSESAAPAAAPAGEAPPTPTLPTPSEAAPAPARRRVGLFSFAAQG